MEMEAQRLLDLARAGDPEAFEFVILTIFEHQLEQELAKRRNYEH